MSKYAWVCVCVSKSSQHTLVTWLVIEGKGANNNAVRQAWVDSIIISALLHWLNAGQNTHTPSHTSHSWLLLLYKVVRERWNEDGGGSEQTEWANWLWAWNVCVCVFVDKHVLLCVWLCALAYVFELVCSHQSVWQMQMCPMLFFIYLTTATKASASIASHLPIK